MSAKKMIFPAMLSLMTWQSIVIASGWNLFLRIATAASALFALSLCVYVLVKDWKDGRKSKKKD